jgi:DHA2 family multidrug resistance protein
LTESNGMTSDAHSDAPQSMIIGSPIRRTVILISVTVAGGLQTLNATIANAILPQMQGDLSAGLEEISWVLTATMIGTAIGMPSAGWLGMRFGRRKSLLAALAIFTLASGALGFSTSLDEVVFWRAVQGLAGGPMLPLTMPILLQVYPKENHGMVMGFWAGGSMLGAVFGPPVGGILAELYNWRVAFVFMVPAGAIALYMIALTVPRFSRRPTLRLDWIGFISLATGLASVQIMLDRGNRLDWFESREIITWAVAAAASLYVFIARCSYARQPFIDLRIFRHKNFAICAFCMLIAGVTSFAGLMLLPSFLGRLQNMPLETVSLMLTPRGIGFMIGIFILGHLIKIMDARAMMAFGFAIQAVAAWYMTTFDLSVGLFEIFIAGMGLGMGEAVLWIPLAMLAFAPLPAKLHDYGSAVIHSSRFLGGGLGISFGVTILARSTQANRAELNENLSLFNEAFSLSTPPGFWDLSNIQGLMRLDFEVFRQAAMIAYVNDFWALALAAVVVLPLIAFLDLPRNTD